MGTCLSLCLCVYLWFCLPFLGVPGFGLGHSGLSAWPFCHVLPPSVDGTRLIFPISFGGHRSSGSRVVSPGGFSPFKRNKTRSRGLPCFRRTCPLVLGANHFSFGRPFFPLGFQLSTGLLPPCPAARWSFGGLMHSCCGVWAMSVRHLMAWPCSAPLGLLRVAHFTLVVLPLSLHVFLSEFILFGPSLLLARFFSRSVFSAAMGLGAWRISPILSSA